MNKRPFVILGLVAVICVIAIPFYVLSTTGEGNAAASGVASQDKEGLDLFATNCGACHTLAAAGTDGVVGPNLDETLVPTPPADPSALADSFEGNATRTLTAVECGLAGRMPKGILQGAQAEEVAAFVAAYAGQISPGAGPSADTDELPEIDVECESSGEPTDAEGASGEAEDGTQGGGPVEDGES